MTEIVFPRLYIYKIRSLPGGRKVAEFTGISVWNWATLRTAYEMVDMKMFGPSNRSRFVVTHLLIERFEYSASSFFSVTLYDCVYTLAEQRRAAKHDLCRWVRYDTFEDLRAFYTLALGAYVNALPDGKLAELKEAQRAYQSAVASGWEW